MPNVPVGPTLLLGFILGLRHALDADHLAAVATIMGGREGLRRSSLIGIWWGAGHALSLGVLGGILVALRIAVPPRVAQVFELAVCVMLIGLGIAALAGTARSRLHAHAHEHDGVPHAHLHFHASVHDARAPDRSGRPTDGAPGDGPAGPRSPGAADEAHRHAHPLRLALRPFLVGSLHGLAGTGALVLLVLTTLPTVLVGWLYIGIFGIGSVAGMAVMSLLLGAPLMIASRRAAWLYGLLRVAAGLGSLGLGIYLARSILAEIAL